MIILLPLILLILVILTMILIMMHITMTMTRISVPSGDGNPRHGQFDGRRLCWDDGEVYVLYDTII